MFSKLQIWFLVGSILLAAGAFAACEIWLRAAPEPVVGAASDSPADTNITADMAEGAPAPSPARPVPETPLPNAYFKLMISSHNTIDQTNGNQNIDADMELKYAHQKTRGGIILTMYSMELKMYEDGSVVGDTLMARDKVVQQAGDQKSVTLFDEMPPEQQAVFASAFATNLCKITLDADQNEFGRQIYSDKGYALFTDGNVNSVRLMHGPYYQGADDWESVKRIPMTKGLVLDCPLEYTKVDGSGGEVKVSGTLTKSEVDSPQEDVVLRNVSCELSGQETFDEAVGEYVAGKMTLQYQFQLFQKGIQTATLDGKLDLTLERVSKN